jgi:integrase
MGGGFDAGQVEVVLYDRRISEDRRVLYALEFLTGLRTGEAAARRWCDCEPTYLGRLGRLTAATAYNTRFRLLKSKKTRVEKWIPVHPALAAILELWQAEGWARFHGRPPTPEDLIVPAERGGPRNNSFSWRKFKEDLKAVGIAHQRHYETRATFISLAEGAGADPAAVARITHASLTGAKDLYRRVRLYWPRMCDASSAQGTAAGWRGVALGVAFASGEGLQVAGSASRDAAFRETRENGRAGETKSPRDAR